MINKFYIGLAGKEIEIHTLNSYTKDMCKEYEMDSGQVKSGSDFFIKINQSDIDFERSKADGVYRDDYLESLAVYRKICNKMADYGIILLHGSAISVECGSERVGVIFIAPSGIGKSTHTKFWKEYLGDKVQYVNDDKPLIDSNTLKIYGTPWDGKHRLSTNTSVKLKAICILNRGNENLADRISADEALSSLVQQTYIPEEETKVSGVLESLNKIAANVDFYRIECRPELVSAEISYKEIFGTEILMEKETISYEQLLEQDGEFVNKAKGTSMMPLIKPNYDILHIKKRPYNLDGTFASLCKKDVILYKRDGKYILHRIARVLVKDSDRNYITYGDNNRNLEYGIRDEEIIGVLDKVIRDGKEINPKSIKYTSRILWLWHKLLKKLGL